MEIFMSYLLAQDTIDGKAGKVTTTINGLVTEHAEIKNITAKIDKKKVEIKTLGQLASQHKAAGWKGTGNVSFYYVTSAWAKMMIDYCKSNKDVYFDMSIVNDDKGSDAGSQRILLKECNIDSVEISKLNTDSDFLDTNFNFTFSGVELLKGFNKLS